MRSKAFGCAGPLVRDFHQDVLEVLAVDDLTQKEEQQLVSHLLSHLITIHKEHMRGQNSAELLT